MDLTPRGLTETSSGQPLTAPQGEENRECLSPNDHSEATPAFVHSGGLHFSREGAKPQSFGRQLLGVLARVTSPNLARAGWATWGQIHFLVLLPHKRRNRPVAITASRKFGHRFHSPGRTETQELKNGSDPRWPYGQGMKFVSSQPSQNVSRCQPSRELLDCLLVGLNRAEVEPHISQLMNGPQTVRGCN
jgi:hypothetical protein